MVRLGLHLDQRQADYLRGREPEGGGGGYSNARKAGWAVVTALLVASALWAGKQAVSGAVAEVALHRAVPVHERRISTLEQWRAQSEARHQAQQERMERLIELLEAEQAARGRRKR